jgi:hypothetical protein
MMYRNCSGDATAGAAKATPSTTAFFSDFLDRGVRKDKCPPHVRDGVIVVPEPFLGPSATSLNKGRQD